MTKEKLRNGDNYTVLGKITPKQKNASTGTAESESVASEEKKSPRAVEK